MPEGVYVPIPSFFKLSEESDSPPSHDSSTAAAGIIDIDATIKHVQHLVDAGCSGVALFGSNGEAVHVSEFERTEAIGSVVRYVQGHVDRVFPIIVGCSALSVWETIQRCQYAYRDGASHALILPPGYYSSILSREDILSYFREVAEASPIPILIYNFPGAANGIDLTSDEIIALASEPNIVGVKLTCGNTGKLARIVHRTRFRPDFFVAGGSADFILQGAVVGAHGTISGLANLAPRSCVKIIDHFKAGRLDAARQLQGTVAEADGVAIKYGFVAIKRAMPMFWGDTGAGSRIVRRPCQELREKGWKEFSSALSELVKMEGQRPSNCDVGNSWNIS
jgi:4-hydroxy-2-oxoglutarate aldolase